MGWINDAPRSDFPGVLLQDFSKTPVLERFSPCDQGLLWGECSFRFAAAEFHPSYPPADWVLVWDKRATLKGSRVLGQEERNRCVYFARWKFKVADALPPIRSENASAVVCRYVPTIFVPLDSASVSWSPARLAIPFDTVVLPDFATTI